MVSNTTEREDNEDAAGAEGISETPNSSVQSGPPSKKEKRDPKLQMLKEAFGILKQPRQIPTRKMRKLNLF